MTPEKRLDIAGSRDWVIHADNAGVLPVLPDDFFRLVYIDPPFNTGKARRRTELATVRVDGGDRIGFGGRRYANLPRQVEQPE